MKCGLMCVFVLLLLLEVKINHATLSDFFGHLLVEMKSHIHTKGQAVIIDAGSSGSRVRVYEVIKSPLSPDILPKYTETFSYKIKPGVSSYNKDKTGLRTHILTLLDKAKKEVPSDLYASTPIYLMATAGMRLVLESEATSMFSQINEIFLNQTNNPFKYKPSNSRILSGEEEGVFAWIAVNYLREALGDKGMSSAGVIEMGGASAQITFQPHGNILANKFPVRIEGKMIDLYAHSYLFYGQERAQERVRMILTGLDENKGKTHIDNPCILKGDTYEGEKQTVFQGAGNPEKCLKLIHEFVFKAPSHECYPKPCAISDFYQPSVSKDKPVYAVGAYKYNVPREILNSKNEFTPDSLIKYGLQYCSKDISTIMSDTGTSSTKYLSARCFMALYIPKLLTVGYNFSPHKQFIIGSKSNLNGGEPEWTLGALIYESEENKCPAGFK